MHVSCSDSNIINCVIEFSVQGPKTGYNLNCSMAGPLAGRSSGHEGCLRRFRVWEMALFGVW